MAESETPSSGRTPIKDTAVGCLLLVGGLLMLAATLRSCLGGDQDSRQEVGAEQSPSVSSEWSISPAFVDAVVRAEGEQVFRDRYLPWATTTQTQSYEMDQSPYRTESARRDCVEAGVTQAFLEDMPAMIQRSDYVKLREAVINLAVEEASRGAHELRRGVSDPLHRLLSMLDTQAIIPLGDPGHVQQVAFYVNFGDSADRAYMVLRIHLGDPSLEWDEPTGARVRAWAKGGSAAIMVFKHGVLWDMVFPTREDLREMFKD